jgi:hypothetical protein
MVARSGQMAVALRYALITPPALSLERVNERNLMPEIAPDQFVSVVQGVCAR